MDEQKSVLQIINSDGKFVGDSLEQHLALCNFSNSGTDYFVASILGSQSSGKSTLMNMLFGTQFSVMTAKFGRRQTTQGVWIGVASTANDQIATSPSKTNSILVLDVEGTDSRERGEDHVLFERKTSLLSLALSDILIINMRATDVGLYDGANYGLLKSIFELNMNIFQQNSTIPGRKTSILFALRDHTLPEDEEHTPNELLFDTIMKDVATLWSDISKPGQFVSSKVDDFFKFSFAALPHKIHKRVAFESAVDELKLRFHNEDSDLFSSGSLEKEIPSDGFPKFVENVWTTIQECRDLNMPSQKEILSIFRCDQISQEVYDEVAYMQIYGIDMQLCTENDAIDTFGSKVEQVVQNCLVSYDEKTRRYMASIASLKRASLIEKIASNVNSGILRFQMRKIIDAHYHRLNSSINDRLCVIDMNVKEYLEKLTVIRDDLIASFKKANDDCIVPSFFGIDSYSTRAEEDEFYCVLKGGIRDRNRGQLHCLLRHLKKEFEQKMTKWITSYIEDGGSSSLNSLVPIDDLNSPSPSVTPGLAETWEEIARQYITLQKHLNDEAFSAADLLCVPVDDTIADLNIARDLCRESLFYIIETISSTAVAYMERRFTSIFLVDADKLPKQWASMGDMKADFRNASLQAERLLDQISMARMDPNTRYITWLIPDNYGSISVKLGDVEMPGRLAVMSQTEVADTLQRFRDRANSHFIHASQTRVSTENRSTVSLVMTALICTISWYIFSNPMVLICILSLIGIVVFKYGIITSKMMGIINGQPWISLLDISEKPKADLNPEPTSVKLKLE